MFVIEPIIEREPGSPLRRTIDRERGLELTEVSSSFDEIYLVLNVRGSNVVIAANYRFSGDKGRTIEYFIRNIGRGLPPKYKPYNFSSREDKLQIANYIEEALKTFGIHHTLSPGQTVEVEFGDHALSVTAAIGQGS